MATNSYIWIEIQVKNGEVTTARDRGTWENSRVEPPPISFPCDLCKEKFETREVWWQHVMKDHPVKRPALFIDGIKRDNTSLITIFKKLKEDSIEIQHADSYYLDNNFRLEADLKTYLSSRCYGIYNVSLVKHQENNVSKKTEYNFDFKIPDESELEKVDSLFFEVMGGGNLNLDVINKFQNMVIKFKTAEFYIDALSNYLYAILAKDQCGGTSLPYNAFKEKYNQSIEILNKFDTDLACNIVSFINLNINNFQLLKDNSLISLVIQILKDPLHKSSKRQEIDNQIATLKNKNNDFSKENKAKIIPVDKVTGLIYGWAIMPTDKRIILIDELEKYLLSNSCSATDKTKIKILIIEMAYEKKADNKWEDRFNKYSRELSTDRSCTDWINQK
jgi:hypothetical protein